jgi:hypothetical protein
MHALTGVFVTGAGRARNAVIADDRPAVATGFRRTRFAESLAALVAAYAFDTDAALAIAKFIAWLTEALVSDALPVIAMGSGGAVVIRLTTRGAFAHSAHVRRARHGPRAAADAEAVTVAQIGRLVEVAEAHRPVAAGGAGRSCH